MKGWRAEDRPCPLCGSREIRSLGVRGGRAHRSEQGGETRVVRCRQCHGVYQRPTLLPERNPYEEHPAEEYFLLHEAARKVQVGERLAAFAETVRKAPGKMLELGCGRGELLRGAARRGWEVRGVEFTESFARIAREGNGIEVECAPIERAAMLDDSYDVILLAAVLEHLYDPVAALKRVHGALRPGGLVFIDVPNECSLLTRFGNAYFHWRGTDWAMNLSPTFAPFHVVGFCPRSLRFVLGATGFRPLSLRSYRTENILPRMSGLRGLCESVAFDIALSLGQLIGMGAGITCWAVRDGCAMGGGTAPATPASMAARWAGPPAV